MLSKDYLSDRQAEQEAIQAKREELRERITRESSDDGKDALSDDETAAQKQREVQEILNL